MIRPHPSSRIAWVLAFSLLTPTARAAAPARTPGPVVREERKVQVAGKTESWRLQWASAPTPVCDVDDPDWDTCPCAGFAFGEQGQLELIRSGASRPEERLDLTHYFADQEGPGKGEGASLQRWPRLPEDDARAGNPKDRAPSALVVHARRPVRILDLHDYNHDGWATELVLQVGAGPCGHQASILVGVARRDPTLHAFGTAEHPKKPLVLPPGAWRKLLQAKAPTEIVDVACGDHGATEESVITLSANAAGLHAVERVYNCGASFKRGKLLNQTVL